MAEAQCKGIASCIISTRKASEEVMVDCQYHTWCLVVVPGLVRQSLSLYCMRPFLFCLVFLPFLFVTLFVGSFSLFLLSFFFCSQLPMGCLFLPTLESPLISCITSSRFSSTRFPSIVSIESEFCAYSDTFIMTT